MVLKHYIILLSLKVLIGAMTSSFIQSDFLLFYKIEEGTKSLEQLENYKN